MSAAKRARVMPSADRIRAVEHALRFDDVMGLVQFHYASSLRAVDAEVKDARDAAIDRLVRAFAIVEALDSRYMAYIRRVQGGENVHMGSLSHDILAGYHQITEFAPELVRRVVAPDYTGCELDNNSWDFNRAYHRFQGVRIEHKRYTKFQRYEGNGLALYHARILLKACEAAGTEAKIREALIIALRLIKEVSPEIGRGFGSDFAIDLDRPELTKSRIYSAHDDDIHWRLFGRDSLYESIRGESSKVRHFEAYQMALYGQRMLNDDHLNRDGEDPILNHHGWYAIEGIRKFAPDLVTVNDCKGPWPGLDSWPILQRLIEATAWAK
jgi:hypothetical protein